MKKILGFIICLSVLLSTSVLFSQSQVNPASLDFGNIQVGEFENSIIEIRNNGAPDLVFTVRSIFEPFSILNDPGTHTLSQNQSFELQLRFTPPDRKKYSSNLIIDTNDPNQTLYEIPLSGNGFGSKVVLSPNSVINFGQVEVDSSASRKVLVFNLPASNPDLNIDLGVENITTTAAEVYSVVPTEFFLAPGDTKSVTITFHPPLNGIYNDHKVNFQTNDKSQTSFEVVLNGDASDRTPPTAITQLQPTWGDFEGLTNSDSLQICWQNPDDSSGIGEVWWKFSSTATPPVSAIDTTASGGRSILTDGVACATIPLVNKINTGRWYCYIWLVDGKGNSGYLNAIEEHFIFDITPPKPPAVLNRVIPADQWFGKGIDFSMTIQLPSDDSRGTNDAREVRWKFNSTPSSVNDVDGQLQLPGNNASQFTFAVPFENDSFCGEGELFFWLSDSTGNSSTDSVSVLQYKFDMCEPMIARKLGESQNIANINEMFKDGFIITDHSAIDTAWVQYRFGGATTVTTRTAVRVVDSDEFTIEIPRHDVTRRGLEIRVIAKDITNNENEWPPDNESNEDVWFPVRSKISGDGLFRIDAKGNPLPLVSGNEQDSYQLFSVPFALENKNMNSVLADDLGEYNDITWRFFDYRPENPSNIRWQEGNTARPFEPGRSFFIITRVKDIIIDSGPARTVNTVDPFKYQVYEGWNLVATPFPFPVHKESISLENAAGVEIPFNVGLRAFDNGWNTVDIMEPWIGYALFVPDQGVSNNPMNLVFEPKEASGTISKTNQTIMTLNNNEWVVKISASAGNMKDLHNWAGIRQNAALGYDDLDYAEPPVIGQFVSVSFPHHDWSQPVDHFSSDMRPLGETDQVWDFKVTSNLSNEIINLKFNLIGDLPTGLEIYLIDEDLNLSQNLGQNPTYSIKSGSEDLSKNLKLVAGSKFFIETISGDIGLVPEQFRLLQNYPNPFNPETNIRYDLPESANVKIAIFNLQGQLVRTLVKGERQEAGFKNVTWDGRDNFGYQVATGVYIYTITTERESVSRKMLLMK